MTFNIISFAEGKISIEDNKQTLVDNTEEHFPHSCCISKIKGQNLNSDQQLEPSFGYPVNSQLVLVRPTNVISKTGIHSDICSDKLGLS